MSYLRDIFGAVVVAGCFVVAWYAYELASILLDDVRAARTRRRPASVTLMTLCSAGMQCSSSSKSSAELVIVEPDPVVVLCGSSEWRYVEQLLQGRRQQRHNNNSDRRLLDRFRNYLRPVEHFKFSTRFLASIGVATVLVYAVSQYSQLFCFVAI